MSPQRVQGKRVRVTMRALVQRINRRLKEDERVLKKTRGERALLDLGGWYVLNWRGNYIVELNVNPETLGRELGALEKWEAVVEEKGG